MRLGGLNGKGFEKKNSKLGFFASGDVGGHFGHGLSWLEQTTARIFGRILPAATWTSTGNRESKTRATNLADQANRYLASSDFQPGMQVIDVVGVGELILVRELTTDQTAGQTSMVLSPSSKLSGAIKPGAWTQIWRTNTLDDKVVTELLVPRAKVLTVTQPEGFLNDGLAAVQVMISIAQSNLIMQSITAELDLFLLPTP